MLVKSISSPDDHSTTTPLNSQLIDSPNTHGLNVDLTSWKKPILKVLFFIVILGMAISIKWSYHTFDAEKYFYDTASYTSVADLPLTSPQFWAGLRPFTLPLLYKLLGVTSENFKDLAVMQRVSLVQSSLSVVSWTILGMVVASIARNQWLRPLIFGMVLVFSLVYDISRWDLLLLSESLAISLFALMLAGWIGLLALPLSWRRFPRDLLVVACVIIITLLYSFTRDSNPYFIVMAAAIFVVVSLFRNTGLPRKLVIIYFLATILVFLAQDASSNRSNRWQLYMYDHIALRFTDTPEFVDYFARAGMPVNQDLYKKPDMRGSVFQNMLAKDPRFAPLRQWMSEHGKATYYGYLLAYPEMTFSQPLIYATQLLNGTSDTVLFTEPTDMYRGPVHKNQFIPRWIRGLSKLVYPIMPQWTYGLVYLGMICLAALALLRKWSLVPWIIISTILVTIYPLMVIVWHGDPLEMGRHALPIAINFRLAGWLAIAFLVDQSITKFKKKTDQKKLSR